MEAVTPGKCLVAREGGPAYNTYQAPEVKCAHSSCDVGFRRRARFGSGSVVGL
jgi:hypothetical protein